MFAAEGYARVTGKAGVCMATSGPGATNLVTGIADAYLDSVPLVAITGQVAQSMIGKGAFQEVDIYGMTLPVVKHSYLVTDAADLLYEIGRAFGGKHHTTVMHSINKIEQSRLTDPDLNRMLHSLMDSLQ